MFLYQYGGVYCIRILGFEVVVWAVTGCCLGFVDVETSGVIFSIGCAARCSCSRLGYTIMQQGPYVQQLIIAFWDRSSA